MTKKLKIPTNKRRERLYLFKFEDEKPENQIEIKSHIELFSNREITVERCLGILDYNSDYIKLRLAKGNVILFGNGLYVSSFETNTIRIKGEIRSLEFCV